MATKVKPSRIKVTGNPQAGQVPVYVDQDNFEWKDNGEVSGPASSTDGDIVLFDGATGKKLKDSGKKPSDYQEKLTTQTAYTAKGTSSKVPQITTNSLGQVTAITEVDISYPNQVSDTAYAASWDGVTDVAPSKNAVYDKIESVEGEISTINGLIPIAATTSNQLADKDFVNNGINSVTAYYITKNANGDQFATYAELSSANTFYSGGVVRVPTRNDYTIVLADENHDNATTRYIYNTTWEYQYTVNETALTQAQLDALNSGITANKVSTYDGYATSKQNTLAGQTAYTSKGTSTKVPTISTNSLGQVTSITETNISFPVTSVNGGTGDITGLQTTANLKTSLSDNSDSYYPSQKAVKSAVDGKQDSLATQTAYTSKGTATKVPTITTNTLGQVTAITETAITFPVTSVNGSTGAVTGLQTTSNLKTGLSDNSDTYYPSQKAVKTAVDGKQDKATSGSGAPTSTPTFVGQQYIDTTNDKMYFATGTSSSSDWALVGSGSGMGDVTGPASSTDGDLVLFDGATGKVIKDGNKKLSDLVQTSGNQTIAGTKTFSTSPVVPSKTTDATNTGTAVATEAQVYKKQDKLTAQTAYTSKGTASKVPQITTNSLGQVTGITEVNITYPSQVSDTAYGNGWDGQTATAPSQNAVYDKISAMDTTISGKQAALATQTAYTSKGTSTKVPTITTNTLGQVTGITETSIAFPVTSVNSQTGAVTVSEVPSGGTDGQVLSKVSGSVAWANPTGGGIGVSTDTGNLLSVGDKLWFGSETDFSGITTPASNTLYIQYKSDGGGGWQPGANTLLYYDFENDSGNTLKNSASSGTIYDGTFNSAPSYGTTTAGKKYFICNATNYATTPVVPFNYGNVTFNMRMYFSSSGTFDFGTGWWSYAKPNVAIFNIGGEFHFSLNTSTEYINNSISDGWHLITMTSDGSNSKIYIDDVLVDTKTPYSSSTTNTYNIGIGTLYEQKHQTPFGGNYGAVIIENAVWSAQEISDYYNLTKGDYGIS